MLRNRQTHRQTEVETLTPRLNDNALVPLTFRKGVKKIINREIDKLTFKFHVQLTGRSRL